MSFRLAAAVAALALAAAPALAQNSSTITPSDVPVSSGGLDPNIGRPAANADPSVSSQAGDPANRTHGADGPVTPRSTGGASISPAARDMSSALAGSGSATSSSDFGPPPSSYPPCRNRSQDRCRVR